MIFMSKNESVPFTIKLSQEEVSLLKNKARHENKEPSQLLEEFVRSKLQSDDNNKYHDSDLEQTVTRVLKEYGPLFKKLSKS